MELLKYHIGLIEHTMSGPNRNWFATGYDGRDSEEFEKLVEAGYATKEAAPSWTCDEVIYRITAEGKKALSEASLLSSQIKQ